jgi:exoribonuclease R
VQDVERGLEEKRLVFGVLRINSKQPDLAYVTVSGLDRDVRLSGPGRRNRAFDGDEVVVKLAHKSEWLIMGREYDAFVQQQSQGGGESEAVAAVAESMSSMSLGSSPARGASTVAEDLDADAASPAPLADGEPQQRPRRARGGFSAAERSPRAAIARGPDRVPLIPERFLQAIGSVVAIRQPCARTTIGTMAPLDVQVSYNGGRQRLLPNEFAVFQSRDPRFPAIYVELERPVGDPEAMREQWGKELRIATVTDWPVDADFPLGTVSEPLGGVGEVAAEVQAGLSTIGIDDTAFPSAVLDDLPPADYVIPDEELRKRRDFRGLKVVTIDPPTAKDMDDAMHVIKHDDGSCEVGVHIADVTFFLREGTLLDKLARERATSVYLVDRVIPMLPGRLSEDLCSLNPGVDRLAFSCTWKFDANLNIVDRWIGRSVRVMVHVLRRSE